MPFWVLTGVADHPIKCIGVTPTEQGKDMRRSTNQFDQLNEFLLNLPDNDDAMLIEELDGLLAGIVV